MPIFKKKPEVITAVQWKGNNETEVAGVFPELLQWDKDHWVYTNCFRLDKALLLSPDLEDIIKIGDWIAKTNGKIERVSNYYIEKYYEQVNQ